MDTAYQHALDLLAQGRVVALIPGEVGGLKTVAVPEFNPSPMGWLAATHPRLSVRAGFAVGVTIGLHRYLQTDPDGDGFIPGHRVEQDA